MKLRVVFPAVYCAVAMLAWLDFSRLPPDGLANIGLMLVVLPVTLLDLALRPDNAPGSFVLMPDRFGYYGDHAMYFSSGVLVIAALLWWLGYWLDARRGGSGSKGS